MIIGLTGPNASGKGEAGGYLRSKGYKYHSLSDILREEAKKLNMEPLRENLIKLGNDLRRKHGPGYLALCLIKRLAGTGDHIVDSIRNPAEAAALRKSGDFVLLGIDAPVEARFKRSLKRKRPGDAASLKEFIEKENKENKTDAENQQLKRCIQMADAMVMNDSSIEELHKKIDAAIEKYKANKAA